MLGFLTKNKSKGVSEILKEGTKLIDEIFTTKEEKLEAKKDLYRMAVAERDSARKMYSEDSWLQKSFALFFLVAWCGLTVLILMFLVFENVKLEEWQIAFVSTIYGGISTKLSTIIDFLFGGSASGSGLIETKKSK